MGFAVWGSAASSSRARDSGVGAVDFCKLRVCCT